MPLTATYRSVPSASANAHGDRLVRIWLWVIAAFVFAMVVVGGATRLTESGLSITEWKVIHGILPPLTHADWLVEFEKYKRIPEYQQINKGMSLSDFQFIYWWEYGHRLLGRVIGFVFLLPFLWFAVRGYIRRDMLGRIGLLFVLGGIQGAIGWWMVASGLTERTDVSQYRLATHLTFACIIFAATVWIAEGFRAVKPALAEPAGLGTLAKAVVVLTLAQIFLGGLVAGLDAGTIYNTWPLMEGRLVPDGLLFQNPWWINFFENHMTVQFVHRIGAYTLFALAFVQWMAVSALAADRARARAAGLVFGLVTVQAIVGIATLVHVVPLGLALVHQGLAVVVLAAAVVHARRLHDSRAGWPAPVAAEAPARAPVPTAV
ncbi:COX15/CtaA family protein [Chthonobacter rhizosphaerae]|uniref:COX15/CtaA family protein n=1 Tax=Chthonobacter rhizosphaerae TaxID=2735553 RepID=UPI0015EF0300|nr:COX15/CtaA family protein [Chthonobacter rhizosphaerae]